MPIKKQQTKIRKSERQAADKRRLQQAQKTGPFSKPERDSVYIFADKALDVSISCTDLLKALDYLTRVTGDEAFRTAALALKGYGLASGGLEAVTKRMLRDAQMTVEDFIAPLMAGPKVSDAEQAAIEYGVPGPSFETVTTKLRKARRRMDNDPARPRGIPKGDTGRKMLVRFGCPTYDADGKQVCACFGIAFDDDGFAVVPDSREWRQAINHGQFVSLGFLSDGEPSENAKRLAWKNVTKKYPSESK